MTFHTSHIYSIQLRWENLHPSGVYLTEDAMDQKSGSF